MRKLLAVLVALAMVFSMTVVAFADDELKKPSSVCTKEEVENQSGLNYLQWIAEYGTTEDGSVVTWEQAWAMYYGQQIGKVSEDPTQIAGVTTEILGDITSGNVDPSTAISAISSVASEAGGDIDLSNITDAVDLSNIDLSSITSNIDLANVDSIVSTVTDLISSLTGSGDSGDGDDSSETSSYTSEEYAQMILDMVENGEEITDITAMIAADLVNGNISVTQIPEIVDYIRENADTSDSNISALIEFLEGITDSIPSDGSSIFDDITLPDFEDFTLPFDIGGSSGGGILDTILSALSGVIGSLFGGDDSSSGGSSSGSDSTEWGSGDSSWDNNSSDFSNNDTGDMSFIAVGAVALVAGAALILTRKKNSNDE